MIIENKNNITNAKRYKVEAKGSNSKSLVIPSSTQAFAGAAGKNYSSNTSTVIKSTSDPALVKSDQVSTLVEQQAVVTSPHKNKKKKSVRFDDIILRKLFQEEHEVDPRAIWYNHADFHQEAKNVQALILKVRTQQRQLAQEGIRQVPDRGAPPHPELRGVEDLASPQSLRCRQMRMKQVLKGVLLEQKRQQLQGTFNPLLLSVRCREFSTIASQLAIQRARWDAKEAAATAAAAC